MRQPHEVSPQPEDIVRFGLEEIARMAPGGHLTDPAYGARREIKEYAQAILAQVA